MQWGGSDAFCAKNSDATLWHKLLHYLCPFCTEFRKATKRSRMHPNSTKCKKNISLGSNGVDRVPSLQKIPTRLRGTNFFTTSAHFEPSFVRHPNGTNCTQIVWNTPKHKIRSQQAQSGVFVAKKYDATSWHKLLHKFGPFCTEFCKPTKRSQMHPNSTKHTKTWV